MKTNDSVILINKIICLVQILVGVVASIFFGVPMIFSLGDESLDPGAFWLIVIFTVLSLWILFCGIQRHKMLKKIKEYINVIGDVPSMKFEELSGILAESEYELEKNLEWMIKKNFFTDAYINYDEKTIISRSAYTKIIQQEEQEKREEKQELEEQKEQDKKKEQEKRHLEYVYVVCECCEGTTKIVKGKIGVCDYCKAPISFEE